MMPWAWPMSLPWAEKRNCLSVYLSICMFCLSNVSIHTPKKRRKDELTLIQHSYPCHPSCIFFVFVCLRRREKLHSTANTRKKEQTKEKGDTQDRRWISQVRIVNQLHRCVVDDVCLCGEGKEWVCVCERANGNGVFVSRQCACGVNVCCGDGPDSANQIARLDNED